MSVEQAELGEGSLGRGKGGTGRAWAKYVLSDEWYYRVCELSFQAQCRHLLVGDCIWFRLAESQRKIFSMMYGLPPFIYSHTAKETAARYGVSIHKVRYIRRKALRLRKALKVAHPELFPEHIPAMEQVRREFMAQ